MWKGDPLEKEKHLDTKKHQFPGFMIKFRGVAFESPRCFRGKNSLLGSREATAMIWDVRFVDGHYVAYKLLMDRYLTYAHKKSTIWSKQFWPTWNWYVRITLPKQCHSSSKHVHLVTISNTEPLNTPVLDWIFPKGKWWSTKCLEAKGYTHVQVQLGIVILICWSQTWTTTPASSLLNHHDFKSLQTSLQHTPGTPPESWWFGGDLVHWNSVDMIWHDQALFVPWFCSFYKYRLERLLDPKCPSNKKNQAFILVNLFGENGGGSHFWGSDNTPKNRCFFCCSLNLVDLMETLSSHLYPHRRAWRYHRTHLRWSSFLAAFLSQQSASTKKPCPAYFFHKLFINFQVVRHTNSCFSNKKPLTRPT